MQKKFGTLHRLSIVALGTLTLIAAFLTVSFSAPSIAQAQVPEATPTPSDPVWRALGTVRAAIEEEKSVDLTWVQSYEWEQAEWAPSIDDCNDDILPNDYRQVYFGWNFTITDLNGVKHYARTSFDLKATTVCDREEQGTPGGGGGDPIQLPDNIVIGDFELGGHVSNLTGEAVTAMNTAGMNWVKKQLRYSPGSGTGQAEAYLQAANDNGYKLLLGIVGYPEDLAGGGTAYVDGFASFLGDVAALGVDAIEVWNEPNIDREWPAGQISGANYTNMLQKAYTAIKAANANTLVISGAPAPTGFFGAAGCTDAGCNDDVFMQQMAAAGAANYMDCVGLHYNEGVVGPNVSSGDPRGEYPTYYFGSMTARGYSLFGGRQVCYTELGYLSGEGFETPIPGGFAWAQNVTVANQAEWLAQAAALAANSGRVRLMIVWNVNFTVWNTDPQAGYAIIRPDGTCPACNALGQVMSN